MTREEFDRLAIFVAVAEELRKEPFFSEDNHDKLSISGTGEGETVAAFFCHPAFLKSAVLPFRRIWMSSELCAFREFDGTGGIRDLVFRDYPDREFAEGCLLSFYDDFENDLKGLAHDEWTKESKRDIIDIWIYTQLAHSGPKQKVKKKAKNNKPEPTLRDFDEWATKIGREKFEYLFRSSIQTIGSYYVQFAEKLAFPLFQQLRSQQGMVPSFEAEVALKYNPYPDSRHRITFDDLFWHVDRESLEETFERLMSRQRFNALQNFLRGLFPKKSDALAAVCRFEELGAVLKGCGVVALGKDAKPAERLRLRSGKAFEVYDGRLVQFHDDSEEFLSRDYMQFRTCLFEERKQQRRRPKTDEW